MDATPWQELYLKYVMFSVEEHNRVNPVTDRFGGCKGWTPNCKNPDEEEDEYCDMMKAQHWEKQILFWIKKNWKFRYFRKKSLIFCYVSIYEKK